MAQSQALAVGKKIFPQSTKRRQPYYLGVGDNTIKLVYSTDRNTCGINALTALTDLPNGALFADAELTTLVRHLVSEAMTVMRAEGVTCCFIGVIYCLRNRLRDQ